jgi:hypothetical protein
MRFKLRCFRNSCSIFRGPRSKMLLQPTRPIRDVERSMPVRIWPLMVGQLIEAHGLRDIEGVLAMHEPALRRQGIEPAISIDAG